MINFIVIEVILTSVLTSALVAVLIFWLLNKKYDQGAKKRIDNIMDKIKNQSASFSFQVDSLRMDLKKIINLLDKNKKKKT